MKLRFAHKALADLDQLYTFLSRETPEAASRLVARLLELSWALADNPKAGRKTDEPGVHVLIVPRLKYLIFYRLTKAEIQILHIRHASRGRWLR